MRTRSTGSRFSRLCDACRGVVLDNRLGRFVRSDRFRPARFPAFLVSLTLHGLIVLCLLLGSFAISGKSDPFEIFAKPLTETKLPEMERLDLQVLGTTDDPTETPVEVGSVALKLSTAEVVSDQHEMLEDISVRDIAGPAAMILPESVRADAYVSIRGAGPETVGGVEGALDRLAVEVHNRLKNGPTLVVWMFDASASLNSERERLAVQIENVYRHVAQLDTEGLASEDALLSAVLGFGQAVEPLSEEPLADPSETASAIKRVTVDTSGIENTFQAVIRTSRKYAKFKRDKTEYQVMIVIVTDEVGDDEGFLEDAIATARRNETPVFVLGSPALFGQTTGRMDYRDPVTGEFYPGLEVRQGPESVMLENIQIPFWYPRQNPGQPLSAGFGPYALSRLAAQSGGIYFISRDVPGWRQFRGEHLREYRPELVTRADYERNLNQFPVRRSLVQASAATQRTIQDAPGLVFPPVEDENFNRYMLEQQSRAAQWSYLVDAAMSPIEKAAQARDREPSRRWRAHYDLMRGRLLALRVRCGEYNSACAKLRKDMPKFQNPASNAWRLEPTDEVVSGDRTKNAAAEAVTYLRKVVEEHPGTPWADLATRELSAPFGFRWVEYTLPQPSRPMPGGGAPPPRRPNQPTRPPIKL
jgi:hypothetical protein